MRPALKAGLLPVWRDRETVQIGVDPRRAVALTGVGGAAGVLRLLAGSRSRGEVLAAAREEGIPEAVTDRVLGLLAEAGVLDDVPAWLGQSLRQGERRRLAAEMAGAALAGGHSDAGAAALARRAAARVRIHGQGRVAAALAELLAASGVGTVTATGLDAGGPGSLGGPGRRRARGGAAPRVAPGVALPDLAILVGYRALARARGQGLPGRLVRAGVPHLAVTAEEAIGVVGPLVRPGRTACLSCLDLARAGLDAAWPLILAQLAGRGADPPACGAALAAAVAAQATGQALALLDAGPGAAPGSTGAAENGTLELVLPGWQWRRRTWPAHPECGCLAGARHADVPGRGSRGP
jgi:hypothetical protein